MRVFSLAKKCGEKINDKIERERERERASGLVFRSFFVMHFFEFFP